MLDCAPLPPRSVCLGSPLATCALSKGVYYLTLPYLSGVKVNENASSQSSCGASNALSYVLMYMSASVCHVEGDTAFKNTGGSRDKHGADRHRSQRYTGTDDTKYFTCCMRTNANGNASKPCAPPRRPSVRRDAPSEPMRILQMSPRKGGRRACSIVQSFHFVHTRPTCMNELSLVWARQAQIMHIISCIS